MKGIIVNVQAKKKAKKRGRPKGSMNSNAVVRAEATRCTFCGSTETTLNGETRPACETHGTDINGKPYTKITWHRLHCKSCGRWSIARKAHFDPKVWIGPLPKV